MPQTILHLACHPRDRSRLLRRAGYRVVEATTQSDALRLACDANPAAIIVAAEPHSNVAELCEGLRAIPVTSAIPVIHVSENGLNGSHPTECSADVCLDEPVESQALVGVLQSVVCTGAAAPYNQGAPRARRNAAAKVDYPGTGWVESIAGGLTDHSKEFSSLCLEPEQTRAHGEWRRADVASRRRLLEFHQQSSPGRQSRGGNRLTQGGLSRHSSTM